jgi:hypothetical protein
MDSEYNIGKTTGRSMILNIKPAYIAKCTYSNKGLGVLLNIEWAWLLK